jgi:Spy/CpxP family protein refolding chaperone
MKPTLPTLTVLLAALILPAACGGMHHHGDFDPATADRRITGHLDDVLDDVKATDAQRARIQAIKSRLLPELAALASSHHKAQQELVAQLSSDHPDQARLHALVDQEIEALRAAAHKSVDGVVEAHATLTPEQRAPLVKKLRRFAAR